MSREEEREYLWKGSQRDHSQEITMNSMTEEEEDKEPKRGLALPPPYNPNTSIPGVHSV